MQKPTQIAPDASKSPSLEELGTIPHLKWGRKYDEKTGEESVGELTISNGKRESHSMLQALNRATGTTDPDISTRILTIIANGCASNSPAARMNNASAMLAALHPKDETEALLLGQFIALQDSGMKCLRDANSQDMFYHIERLFALATKLLNVANQTMHALMKYRSGGQQTVQVVHLHNEGQAIVAQNLSQGTPGGGVHNKSTN